MLPSLSQQGVRATVHGERTGCKIVHLGASILVILVSSFLHSALAPFLTPMLLFKVFPGLLLSSRSLITLYDHHDSQYFCLHLPLHRATPSVGTQPTCKTLVATSLVQVRKGTLSNKIAHLDCSGSEKDARNLANRPPTHSLQTRQQTKTLTEPCTLFKSAGQTHCV